MTEGEGQIISMAIRCGYANATVYQISLTFYYQTHCRHPQHTHTQHTNFNLLETRKTYKLNQLRIFEKEYEPNEI